MVRVFRGIDIVLNPLVVGPVPYSAGPRNVVLGAAESWDHGAAGRGVRRVHCESIEVSDRDIVTDVYLRMRPGLYLTRRRRDYVESHVLDTRDFPHCAT